MFQDVSDFETISWIFFLYFMFYYLTNQCQCVIIIEMSWIKLKFCNYLFLQNSWRQKTVMQKYETFEICGYCTVTGNWYHSSPTYFNLLLWRVETKSTLVDNFIIASIPLLELTSLWKNLIFDTDFHSLFITPPTGVVQKQIVKQNIGVCLHLAKLAKIQGFKRNGI